MIGQINWDIVREAEASRPTCSRTATHEASHAAAAWSLGLPIKFIELDERGGLCQLESRTDPDDFSFGVFAAAGLIGAQKLLHARGAERGFVDALAGAGSDREKMRRFLPDREAQAAAQDRADELVEQHWPRILKLAEELDRKRHLSGERVVEILTGKSTAPGHRGAAHGAPPKPRPQDLLPAPAVSADPGKTPWLVATRSYSVGAHRVVAGETRCLPGSPAQLSDPSAWRAAGAGEGQRMLETRVSGEPVYVRG